MKKILRTALPILLMSSLLSSCYEDYIKDHESPSCGFAISNPLRTVVADRDMPVYVGVSIGGKREVDMSDWATFTLDGSLLEDTGLTMLPEEYYTLGDPSKMTVRKSNMPVADVEIRFTDAFFADPLSTTTHYALPFRLTGSSLSRIVDGTDWSVVAVKYVSTFSGTYYLRGTMYELDEFGDPMESVSYYQKDLVKCLTRNLLTQSRTELIKMGVGNLSAGNVNRCLLTIEKNASKVQEYNVYLSSIPGAVTILEGTGTYYGLPEDGGMPRIELSYTFTNGTRTYHADEEMILRQDPLYDLRIEYWK